MTPSETSIAEGLSEAQRAEWRTDSPPFGQRPIWQFVFVQGEQYHSGHTWMRAGWGTAAIRTNGAPDGYLGYRRSDIERICTDNGIDFHLGPVVVGWLPAMPPALLTEETLPRLLPSDDGEWAIPPERTPNDRNSWAGERVGANRRHAPCD